MAQAHVDPGELRRFARDLTRFNADVQTLLSALNSRMQQLEQSWQDQEQQKFAEEFAQTVKALGRFLESSARHTAFLNKKARHIEEYLQQR